MPNVNRAEYYQNLRANLFGGEYLENLSRVMFNSGGQDVDFIWQTDTNTRALVLDAGLFSGVGQLSIGVAAQTTATAFVIIDNPALTAVASQNFFKLSIDNTAIATIPAGTADVVASVNIDEPNITATGTVTNACSLRVEAAPTEGTNNYAFWVDAGRTRLETTYSIASAAGAVWDGVHVPADTATLTGSTGVTTAGGFNMVQIGQPTLSAAAALTVTNSATLRIADEPTGAGTGPATITNAYALWVDAGHTRIDTTASVASAAGAAWNGANFTASTLTITGSTGITNATGVNMIAIGQPTLSAASALTVTNAATLYVAAAPTVAASAVLTNAYSLWIDAGNSRFDGRVLFGQGADVASGTTITLGNDGNYFVVTGTTQTDFITNTGWTAGSIVMLKFNGIVTVRHNQTPAGTQAAFLLTSGASFVSSADDTLTLVYDGTAFREIARAVI